MHTYVIFKKYVLGYRHFYGTLQLYLHLRGRALFFRRIVIIVRGNDNARQRFVFIIPLRAVQFHLFRHPLYLLEQLVH